MAKISYKIFNNKINYKNYQQLWKRRVFKVQKLKNAC